MSSKWLFDAFIRAAVCQTVEGVAAPPSGVRGIVIPYERGMFDLMQGCQGKAHFHRLNKIGKYKKFM